MKTETLTEAALERVDEDTVMQHYLRGTPIPAEVSVRVKARAAAITERLRQTHGESIDVDRLIHEAREEQ
jgi:hypothetical protein